MNLMTASVPRTLFTRRNSDFGTLFHAIAFLFHFRFHLRSFLARSGISGRHGQALICVDGGMSDAKITCTSDVLNRNLDHGLG